MTEVKMIENVKTSSFDREIFLFFWKARPNSLIIHGCFTEIYYGLDKFAL